MAQRSRVMADPIMVVETALNRAVKEPPWSRAIRRRASCSAAKSDRGTKGFGLLRGRLQRPGGPDLGDHGANRGRQRHLLGPAGRAGTAHVAQFTPVGVGGPSEKFTPE